MSTGNLMQDSHCAAQACLSLRIHSLHDNPGDPPHQSVFRDPKVVRARGFDVDVLHDHKGLQTAVPLDNDRRVIGDQAGIWIQARAVEIDAFIQSRHAAGLGALVATDILLVPDFEPAELEDYDILSERGLDWHRKMFRAICDRFPDLDGIVIRSGEAYDHDLPFHRAGSPFFNHDPSEVHKRLIAMLRSIVCDQFDKYLVYRTWSFGGIHTDPEIYLDVTNSVPTHPKLLFSIKHTAGDFHRTFEFNPTIGIGNHRQIVEVQCQREYEGKGAFPNYIAKGVIDGFEELSGRSPSSLSDLLENPLFAGLWAWSRGGGWKGPYPANEFWCALNAGVLGRWAQAPLEGELSAFEVAAKEDFNFSADDIFALRRICLLSSTAVLEGKLSRFVEVNPFWLRDEFLGGVVPQPVAEAANSEQWGILNATFGRFIARGEVEPVLKEKAFAESVWHEIWKTSQEIEDGQPLTSFIRTSCEYGLRLQRVINAGWTVILTDMQGESSSDKMHYLLSAYDKAWSDYEHLGTRPECSTLFKPFRFVNVPPDFHDGFGMANTIDVIRQKQPSTASTN